MTMNSDWLLKHFEQISEAPDAIPRLRRFILDLAVRGKLVEQNPKDEPASELLKRIDAEKEHRENAGGIRKPKLLLLVEDEIAHFEIPETWKWTHVEDVAHVEMGQSPSSEFYNKHHEGLPFYQGKADFGKIHPTPRYWCTAPTKLAEKGDILISVRAPVGPTNVSTETCCIGRGLAALRPYQGYERDFLLICLKKFEPDLEALGAGTTFVAINRKHLVTFPVPLPPLAEQQRIVAKVDELMSLCDELEVAQAKRERRRDRLVAATLHGLNNGDDSSEPGGHPTFEENARFYFNHLPRLTTRPEHIHQLRQTILNFAVRGKLVPQDPKDEPASELIERIRAKKGELIKGRVGSKGRAVAITENDILFKIPKNWVWVQSTEPAVLISDKGKKLQTKDVLESGEFPVVDQGKVFVRGYCNDIQKVIRVDGPIIVFGDHTRETKLIDFDFVVGADGVKLLKPIEIVPAYYFLALQWVPLESRGYARHYKLLRVSCFPLPPLAEQQRIVAKVDELMALCDEIEAQVTSSATTRRQLLEATLTEAIAS